MNIIVCEDSKTDSIDLCNFVKRFFAERCCPVHITAYETGEDFLKSYKTGDVQIAFLDIYLPGISGVDVAKKIRKTNDSIAIIFTTSSADHGFDGYCVDALGYILKPVEYEQLSHALVKCQKLFEEELRFITIKSERMIIKILHKNIMFIEVFSNTCLFHTITDIIKCNCSLNEVEEQLDSKVFLRCHRSFIVNMNYIAKIMENDFVLINGVKIPIRRAEKLSLKQVYYDYLFMLTRRAEM